MVGTAARRDAARLQSGRAAGQVPCPGGLAATALDSHAITDRIDIAVRSTQGFYNDRTNALDPHSRRRQRIVWICRLMRKDSAGSREEVVGHSSCNKPHITAVGTHVPYGIDHTVLTAARQR